jgi:hypothetical protein
VSTILHLHQLNSSETFFQQIAAPHLSVAAQDQTPVFLAVGVLVLLLVIVLILFSRMSRKPRAVAPTPTEASESITAPLVAPTAAPQPAIVTLDFAAEAEQRINFTVDKPVVTIGRASDNDLVMAAPILNVDTVSQHHARLRRDPDGYVVRDLGSKNGLSVNGRQTLENLLQDGDRVMFGEVEAIFHQSGGGAA